MSYLTAMKLKRQEFLSTSVLNIAKKMMLIYINKHLCDEIVVNSCVNCKVLYLTVKSGVPCWINQFLLV